MNRILILSHLLLFLNGAGMAQSLSSPESILWDGRGNHFLVSNAATGDIQVVEKNGNMVLFSKEVKGSHGLTFYGSDLLLSCYKNRIFVSDRFTGKMLIVHELPGAVFLNGICTDKEGHVYVTDFTKRVIFKISKIEEPDYSISLFKSLGRAPNGIDFDAAGQELVVVTWGANAEILHLDLQSADMRTVPTRMSNLEAIIKDGNGGFYISSWVPGGIYRYDGTDLVNMNLQDITQPTGITVDDNGDLYVLSSYDKEFRTIPVNRTSKSQSEDLFFTAFPNPMSINSLITYELPKSGQVNISVYDCQGNLVEQLVTEQKTSGKHQFFYDRGTKRSGLYFINIQTSGQNKAIAVTLVD
ncbi:MAG: T9SS type A sorting domain-containing protein [Bacteroidetes bacterium]|jgi:sugar lactone lactonase YvrE|nr:T9SS type A sorting domain-containing protein [Bacteroidota bacterium]